MSRTLLILSLFILVRCASLDRGPTNAKTLRVIATVHRQAELEPCGCEFNPEGGINREWNLTRKIMNSSTAYVLAGPTFAPVEFNPKSISTYDHKAAFVIEALNTLGVEAVAPTLTDLKLGHDRLVKYSKISKFPFVTTNLFDKKTKEPLFHRFIILNKEVKVGVLGLTQGKSKDVEVQDPIVATEKALKELEPQVDFIILLTDLNTPAIEKLNRKFPQIHLIVGGPKGTPFKNAAHLGDRTLIINPYEKGREMTTVTLHIPKNFTSYFNENHATNAQQVKEIWTQRKADLTAEAKSNPKKAKAIQKDIADLDAKLKQAETVALKPTATSATYDAETYSINKDYETPENPLTELMARYKESLRSLALEE